MRRHIRYGISDSACFQLSINEASSDPVGFWSIVRKGQEGFGLNGKNLDDFVFDYVLAMLEAGANPVVGDRSSSSGWRPVTHY